MKSKKKSGGLIIIILIAMAAGYYLSSTVRVPDVSGLPVEEAKAQLMEASLLISEGEPVYSEEYRKGRVISVENSGERLKKNSTVEIVESLGAEIPMYMLIGETQEAAEQKLGSAGISMKFVSEYSEEYEEGLVITQSVEEGTIVHEEDKVLITVSKGPEPFELADYKEKNVKDVKKEAEERGLVLVINEEYSSDAAKGKVIAQSPEAGTEVKKGDIITLTVSKGAEQVKVPNIVGKSKSEAEKALKKAGFKIGKISYEYSNSVAEGKVISQKVKGGDEVDKGSAIDFVISNGKKPSYKPSGGSSGGSSGKPTDLTGDSEGGGPTDLT